MSFKSLEAVVYFAFNEDAKECIENLHMTEIGGKVISCTFVDDTQ